MTVDCVTYILYRDCVTCLKYTTPIAHPIIHQNANWFVVEKFQIFLEILSSILYIFINKKLSRGQNSIQCYI